MVWLCDQESTETFLKGDPPGNRKLRRWWTFLAQLKVKIYRVLGLKNELCDWISRENSTRKFLQALRLSLEKLFRKWMFIWISLWAKRNYSVLYGGLTLWRSMEMF